ncbi:MAG: hypothetical protein IMY82_06925 [Chloroflexi bacterium]|nr:hypothetical protein [Chloroflexota bacterium]
MRRRTPYAAQTSMQINAATAEKNRFWTETGAMYIIKFRKIAPGFDVPARRDFSCIAVAMQLKSQRSWRGK